MKLLNLLQTVAHVEAGDSDSAIADFLLSKAHEHLPGLAGALHSFDVTSIAWAKAKIIRVFRQLLQGKQTAYTGKDAPFPNSQYYGVPAGLECMTYV